MSRYVREKRKDGRRSDRRDVQEALTGQCCYCGGKTECRLDVAHSDAPHDRAPFPMCWKCRDRFVRGSFLNQVLMIEPMMEEMERRFKAAGF